MEMQQILMDASGIVLWRVSGVSDFQRILPTFLRGAKDKQRRVCYIHFSQQTLIPRELESSAEICNVPLSHRFEAFTIAVHNQVQKQPEGTFFLFDSLSDLQTAWATDLMMANFFRVVLPQVRKIGGAFFPLVRSMHSENVCEEIKRQADVFLDLYSDFNRLYLKAVKIEGMPEDSECFLPHCASSENPRFEQIADGDIMRRFFQTAAVDSRKAMRENRDAWEQFFDRTQRRFESGVPVDEECRRMSEIMMSRDTKIREMLNRHFTPVDYFCVREHMVGTGLIGGKACGMLIAQKIIENRRPDIYERMEAHDSFYIGSDVFYSYIVDNDFWDLRVRQRTEEGYFAVADRFAECLRTGIFSERLKKEFIRVLEYYGNCPIIVRSSSILEDGFGNAFAGKYESVFCMGTGTLEERLEEFENAIRIVYASTMSRSALDYRLRRGLANRDEQMSLLVMRVSGSFFGDYYFPTAAGVGYSYSSYRFAESLDPNAGTLRLVMGLGTAAVDRTEDSYPRLVSLDRPQMTVYKNVSEHHRYSQRRVDVINTKTSKMEKVDPEKLRKLLPYSVANQLYEHNREVEANYRNRGVRKEVTFVSCPGLVRNDQLMKDLQQLMQTIQTEYGQPVDIEYAINLDEKGGYLLNLLQCRPLQVFKDTNRRPIPEDLAPETIFLESRHASMGLSRCTDVDLILFVDPIAYYNLPYADKPRTAACIGRINWKLRGQGKKILLFAPGRLGTSSPELGVPTTFSDISEFSAVFELAESKAGYNPELSYGSHMFQDLVEADILYSAVFENNKVAAYHPEKLQQLTDRLQDYDTEDPTLRGVVRVFEVSGRSRLYFDMLSERLVCTLDDRKEE